MIAMNAGQLELGLANRTLRSLRADIGEERRMFVARLWFHRMHHVVDRAREWSRTRVERPEQKYLTLT